MKDIKGQRRKLEILLLSLMVVALVRQSSGGIEKTDNSLDERSLSYLEDTTVDFENINQSFDSLDESKGAYTEEEIALLLEEGTVIKMPYGNGPFCVYYIRVQNPDAQHIVPQGYEQYQELLPIATSEGVLYHKTPVYVSKKSETTRGLK